MCKYWLRMSKIFLNSKKTEDIYKMINNTDKLKPRINMTTKRPSCKQIIIHMGNENITKFMVFSGEYIANINYTFKGIKLDIFVNFICFDYHGLMIKLSFLLILKWLRTILEMQTLWTQMISKLLIFPSLNLIWRFWIYLTILKALILLLIQALLNWSLSLLIFSTISTSYQSYILSKSLWNLIWQMYRLIYGIPKVVCLPRLSLTIVSILPYKMQTLKFPSTRIARRCHKLHSACISTTSGPIFTN